MLEDQSEIFEALDKSSQINRTLGTTFALLMFYIAINVASTTDLMLFIPNSAFEIPLLSIKLPVFEFYVAAPFLVLLLHYNLLFNLQQHSKKLVEWRKKENSEIDELKLYPFLFNFSMTKLYSLHAKTLNYVIRLTLFYIPLSLLFYIFYRFADYHSWKMTLWHFIAIILDIGLIFTHTNHILQIINFNDKTEDYNIQNYFKFVKRGKRFLRYITNILIFIFKVIPFATSLIIIIITSLGGKMLNYATAFFNSQSYNPKPMRQIFKNKIKTISFFKIEVVVLLIACLYYFLFILLMTDSRIQSYKSFLPYLDLKEQQLVRSEPEKEIIDLYIKGDTEKLIDIRIKFTKGYDLKYRDFRFANFFKANLINADLRYTKLDDADLSYANLQGANLKYTQIENANLNYAQLQGIDLRSTRLKNNTLKGSNLLGANLMRVKGLHGTDLSFAQLQEADLNFAQLYGSNLDYANLQGADLREIKLIGASLYKANLKGTDLSFSKLQGADLRNAEFLGAKLMATQFQGANLEDAEFNGTILSSNTNLRGVEMTRQPATVLYISNYKLVEDIFLVDESEKDIEKLANMLFGQTDNDKGSKFNKRLMEAQKRYENSSTENEFPEDFNVLSNLNAKFLEIRQEIASSNAHVARGMLRQQESGNEENSFVNSVSRLSPKGFSNIQKDSLYNNLYHYIKTNYPVYLR